MKRCVHSCILNMIKIISIHEVYFVKFDNYCPPIESNVWINAVPNIPSYKGYDWMKITDNHHDHVVGT